MTRLIVSEVAAQAIVDQVDYYLEHGGNALGTRWDAAVTKTISSLLNFPERGAKRHWNGSLAGIARAARRRLP